MEVVGREHFETVNDKGRRGVYVTWHQNVPGACSLHQREKLCVLISSHRDGEIIAKAVHAFRMRSVRGSSSRDGARALLQMLQEVGDDWGLVLTPDGPRGPRHSTAPGTIYIAAAGRRSIVATGFAARSYWRLGSWDRMEIPKPFTRVVVVYREPVPVPREVMRDEALMEQWLDRLAQEIHAAHDEARQHLEAGDAR